MSCPDAYEKARARLLREIVREAEETRNFLGRDRISPRVLDVMGRIPRHLFVPEHARAHAYENRPLPIGFGQTISQPYIVAAMTELLELEPHHRVLEIGTGCGYQTAVLAELVQEVVSLEVVEPLARDARRRLADIGYRNVQVHCADGFRGWPERAPYDRILVAAAAPALPEALVEQLGAGGRMVIPLGQPHARQFLTVVTRQPDGRVLETARLPVAFVPMVHGRGDQA